MLITNKKSFSDSRFPRVGQNIEAYAKEVCFGETYYLVEYNGLFISLKEKDREDVNEVNGQLSLI